MEKKSKLELTWTGKYLDSKLEPRILIEMENKSVYGDINQNLWRDFLNFPYFTGFSAH